MSTSFRCTIWYALDFKLYELCTNTYHFPLDVSQFTRNYHWSRSLVIVKVSKAHRSEWTLATTQQTISSLSLTSVIRNVEDNTWSFVTITPCWTLSKSTRHCNGIFRGWGDCVEVSRETRPPTTTTTIFWGFK